MQLSKPELRRHLKEARLGFSAEERQSKSQKITDNLIDIIDWSNIKNIHLYEPISELAEVDISGLKAEGNTYTSRKIDSKWQIVSVSGGSVIPAIFDVIIVPMLGFDESLHRIGYGGGYYDRFLAEQPKAMKIGVCYESGFIRDLPTEDHDIPMDIIITEEKVRR